MKTTLSIMLKPASSSCNLRCSYCFYHSLAQAREVFSTGLMSRETASAVIDKALYFADGNQVAFSFQGGEPLLAGIDFFKFFTQYVAEHNKKNSPICYGLQTNGTLIDERWARFFRDNGFLVGVSLDGDEQLNSCRVFADNTPAYTAALNGAKLLLIERVPVNVLCVLTKSVARNITRVWEEFVNNGFTCLQFIPCLQPLEGTSKPDENSPYMSNADYLYFLKTAFNLYKTALLSGKYVSVRYFDNLVRLARGERPEQCGMSGFCSFQYVVEANGDAYPCDFYCTDKYLLGNLNRNSFGELASGAVQQKFVMESQAHKLNCKQCRYYRLCRAGGCKRVKAHANYCMAYYRFFEAHATDLFALGKITAD